MELWGVLTFPQETLGSADSRREPIPSPCKGLSLSQKASELPQPESLLAPRRARDTSWVKRWGCVVVAILAVTTISIKYGRKYVLWDNFGPVESGRIYRSGQLLPYQLRAVANRYQLRAILNLNHDPEDDEEERLAQELGLNYFKAGWRGDGLVSEDELRWAYDVMANPANQPILVHCARGTSRTGALVAYYRIRQSLWSRDQIRAEMVSYRHRPHRNLELEQLVSRLFMQTRAEPQSSFLRDVSIQPPPSTRDP